MITNDSLTGGTVEVLEQIHQLLSAGKVEDVQAQLNGILAPIYAQREAAQKREQDLGLYQNSRNTLFEAMQASPLTSDVPTQDTVEALQDLIDATEDTLARAKSLVE